MQEDEEEEEDVLFLLDESEALGLVEFDPTVDSKTNGSHHNLSSPSWRNTSTNPYQTRRELQS